MIEMSENQIIQDNKNEEKTEREILKILRKVCWKDRETLKNMIEKLIDLQVRRIHRNGQSKSAYWYWNGKSDVWDKIFQELMGKSQE